jgi:hypothetical protein
MKKKKETSEKFYEVKLQCINCKKWKTIQIPLGMKLLIFLKNNTCENCGCTFVKNVTEYKLIYPTIIGV